GWVVCTWRTVSDLPHVARTTCSLAARRRTQPRRYAFNEHEPLTASTARGPAGDGSPFADGAQHGIGLRRAGGGARLASRPERGAALQVADRRGNGGRHGRRRGGNTVSQ